MKKNIGKRDRLLRLAISIIVGVMILFVDLIVVQILLAMISLFVLYEALAGWCALNTMLGKNTCDL